MPGLLAILQAHKQRIARLIALSGILIVGSLLMRGVPRKVDVEFDIGPDHRNFVEIRVAYVQGGEELHGVKLSFPDGVPGSVQHSVQLPEGEFEVHTELRPERGPAVASVGRLRAPSDGRVHIRVPTEPR